jgi:hypothetical protein
VKATKGKTAKASYDLGGVDVKPKPEKKAPAPKVEKPKVEKAAPKPKPVPVAKTASVKPAPVAKAAAVKDPNAVPTGVALGAAPLLLAPIALLAAGRGALQGTKDRRDKIQKEIAAFEAAKAKKAVSAEVDGGGVVTALVSGQTFGNVFDFFYKPRMGVSDVFVFPFGFVGILGSFGRCFGFDCQFSFLAVVHSC